MKIALIIDSSIGDGGGFDQSLNTAIQLKKLSENKFNLMVFTTNNKNPKKLERLGIEAVFYKPCFFDKLLARISDSFIGKRILFNFNILTKFEKTLIESGIDLVYFASPNSTSNQLFKLNFIYTVWDMSHRDTPEFPEVRSLLEFSNREENYRKTLPYALLILCDSEDLCDLASSRYGIDRNRLLSMPFSASPLINSIVSLDSKSVRVKYNLTSNFYYYPAQFWPHKNHARILEALVVLRDNFNYIPKVVFSGKDYGNRSHIESLIKEFNLQDQVNILGFIPSEDVRGLYENSIAVVMPTYFGQTNLPPLEAWSLNVPLIYSDLFKEQSGDAALSVNPDSSFELANAMLQVLEPAIRKNLIEAGKIRLDYFNTKRIQSEKVLLSILDKFSQRLINWKF